MQLRILVTCAMGLETVLKYELYDLGYKELSIDNGTIALDGTLNDIIALNLWCRTAGRVFISLPSFTAHSFDDLFDAISNVDWHKWYPKNVRCTIDSVIQRDLNYLVNQTFNRLQKKPSLLPFSAITQYKQSMNLGHMFRFVFILKIIRYPFGWTHPAMD